MNKVFLMGRLTRDPELRTTSNNVQVATFTIAVDRRFKDSSGQKVADFFPVVAWRQQAEFCAKYFRKGSKMIVIGEIQTRSWDDQDGKKHSVTEVIADEVEFAESKSSDQTPRPVQPPPEDDTSLPFDI